MNMKKFGTKLNMLREYGVDPISIRVYETIAHRVDKKVLDQSIFIYRLLRDNVDRVGPKVFETIIARTINSRIAPPYNEHYCHYIGGGFIRLWLNQYRNVLEEGKRTNSFYNDDYDDDFEETTERTLTYIAQENKILDATGDYLNKIDIDFYGPDVWNPERYQYQTDLVLNIPSTWMVTDSSIKVEIPLDRQRLTFNPIGSIPLAYNFNKWRTHFNRTREDFEDHTMFHIGKIIMEHDFFHTICHFSIKPDKRSFIPFSAIITSLSNTLVPNKPLNKISHQRVKKLIDMRGMSWYNPDSEFMDYLNTNLNGSSDK